MWKKGSFLGLDLFGGGHRLPKHLAGLSSLDLLILANQEVDQGNCLEAAQIYDYLGASFSGKQYSRAAYIFLQAGRAFVQGNQPKHAMDCFKMGLSMLSQANRTQLMLQVGSRIVGDLNYRGLRNEAQLVTNWLDALNGGSIQSFGRPVTSFDPTRPRLPLKCPFCKGNLLPDEMDWLDTNTAECPYCGSAVQGDNG